MKKLLATLILQAALYASLFATNGARDAITQKLDQIKGVAPSGTIQRKYDAATAALKGTVSDSRLNALKTVAEQLTANSAYKNRPSGVKLDLFLYVAKLVIKCSETEEVLPQNTKDLIASLDRMAELTSTLAKEADSETTNRLSDTATLHMAWLLSRNDEEKKQNTTRSCKPSRNTKKAIAKKALDEAEYWKKRRLSKRLQLWIIASTTYLIAGSDSASDKVRVGMMDMLRSIERKVAEEAAKEEKLSPDQQAARRQAIEKLAGILAEDEKFFSIGDKQKLLNDINNKVKKIEKPTFDKMVSVLNEEAGAAEEEVKSSKQEAGTRTSEIVDLYSTIQEKIGELAPDEELDEEGRQTKDTITADLCGIAQEAECPEGITPTEITKGKSLEERLTLLTQVGEYIQPLKKKEEATEIDEQIGQIKDKITELTETQKVEAVPVEDEEEEPEEEKIELSTAEKIIQKYDEVKTQIDQVASDEQLTPGGADTDVKKKARAEKKLILADLCSITQKTDCPGVAPSTIAEGKTEDERLALLEIIGKQITLRMDEFESDTWDKALEKIKEMIQTTVNPDAAKPPPEKDEEEEEQKEPTKEELFSSISNNLDKIAPSLDITENQVAKKEQAEKKLQTIARGKEPEKYLKRIDAQIKAIADTDSRPADKLNDAAAVIERIAEEAKPKEPTAAELKNSIIKMVDEIAPDTKIAENDDLKTLKTTALAKLDEIATGKRPKENLKRAKTEIEKFAKTDADVAKKLGNTTKALEKIAPKSVTDQIKERYKGLKKGIDELAPDTELAVNAEDNDQVKNQKEAAQQAKNAIIADLCSLAQEAECPEGISPSQIAQGKAAEQRLDLLKAIGKQLESRGAELKELSAGEALQKIRDEVQKTAVPAEVKGGTVFRRWRRPFRQRHRATPLGALATT